MPRIGSRIRTVAPAFPAQGPANVAGLLVGTVVQPRRLGQNVIVRARAMYAARSLADIPERAMVIRSPSELPAATTPAPPAGLPPTGGCTDCA